MKLKTHTYVWSCESRSVALLVTVTQLSQLASLAQVPPEQLTCYLAIALAQLQPAVSAGVTPACTVMGLMVLSSKPHTELSGDGCY